MTFAGSRDRVESQLVPEAGFELDTFAISGFPRRLGIGLVRALWQAARAPFACSRILARRRPDVVLGGGGYVAGPMVLAARLRGIPAALTEADAHLGLANRLAAPFARRVLLAYAIDGRDGAKYRVVGRPIPAAHLGSDRAAARARLGLPADRPVLAVFGGLAGAQALNELAVEAFGAAGPALLHVSGARDYDALRPHVTREDYVLIPSTEHFGDALAAADLAISRAGGTVWELAAAGLDRPGGSREDRQRVRRDRRQAGDVDFQSQDVGGEVAAEALAVSSPPVIDDSLQAHPGDSAAVAELHLDREPLHFGRRQYPQ